MTTGEKIAMITQATRDQVREFLGQYFRQELLDDDEDMFAAGYVNSLFAMQLILFLEAEFAFTIDDEDLELDNFRSIARIVGFVARKRDVAA
ncbi:MAG: acyl carrier protein [Actinophytocola sp.]|uniref:acyl carrier protein n=1 Tax=Actinophytocola sp. TaxID=1872138 RepID=UPI003C7187B9